MIHRETWQVKGYDVDRNLSMNPTALIRCMHDAAIEQILRFGVSANELKPLGLGWVLVHQDVHFRQYPVLGDRIEITTHPSGKDRLYTYRDYIVRNPLGKIIASASTAWILMDIRERKRAVYPTFLEDLLSSSNKLPALERPQMQKKRDVSFDEGVVRIPQYSEIDFNGHLSNYYFFKWMMDSLPVHILSNFKVTQFNIKFRGEAFEGDRIIVQFSESNNGCVHHQIIRDGIAIVHGYSLWDKIS